MNGKMMKKKGMRSRSRESFFQLVFVFFNMCVFLFPTSGPVGFFDSDFGLKDRRVPQGGVPPGRFARRKVIRKTGAPLAPS